MASLELLAEALGQASVLKQLPLPQHVELEAHEARLGQCLGRSSSSHADLDLRRGEVC